MDGRNPAPVDRWFIPLYHMYIYHHISYLIPYIYIYTIISYIIYHHIIYHYTPDITIISYIYLIYHIIYHIIPYILLYHIIMISYIYIYHHIIISLPYIISFNIYIYTTILSPWLYHIYVYIIYYITIISSYAPLYITCIAPVFPEAFRGDRIDAMQVKEAIPCDRHVFAACLWSPQKWIKGGWSPPFYMDIQKTYYLYNYMYIYRIL